MYLMYMQIYKNICNFFKNHQIVVGDDIFCCTYKKLWINNFNELKPFMLTSCRILIALYSFKYLLFYREPLDFLEKLYFLYYVTPWLVQHQNIVNIKYLDLPFYHLFPSFPLNIHNHKIIDGKDSFIICP